MAIRLDEVAVSLFFHIIYIPKLKKKFESNWLLSTAQYGTYTFCMTFQENMTQIIFQQIVNGIIPYKILAYYVWSIRYKI